MRSDQNSPIFQLRYPRDELKQSSSVHRFMHKSMLAWAGLLVCLGILVVDFLWLAPECSCPSFHTSISTVSSASFYRGNKSRPIQKFGSSGRTIYVITPTYRRQQQIAELTRLSQTLMLVPDLVWLVIEDAVNNTDAVEDLLKRSGLEYVHITAPMPELYRNASYSLKQLPRGVSNRNRGLEWIRENATSGVIFFADDDNTYDIRLFEEMRDTKRVTMWPVGFLSRGFFSPVIRNGKVVNFYQGWIGCRKFPVDMAGFAVSVEFLLQRPDAKMPFYVGYEEDGFLKSLKPFTIDDIEVKASNCTQVLVWHTQTKSPPKLSPVNLTVYEGTNVEQLYQSML